VFGLLGLAWRPVDPLASHLKTLALVTAVIGVRGQVLLAFDAAFVALLSLLQAIRYRMGRSSVGSGMASSPGRPTPTVLRPP